jgi:hypothetical protein
VGGNGALLENLATISSKDRNSTAVSRSTMLGLSSFRLAKADSIYEHQ